MNDRIKLTINKVLYENEREETDVLLKTKIPYRKDAKENGNLWINKNDMHMLPGNNGFMLEIDPDAEYDIYGSNGPNSGYGPIAKVRGDELYEEHYEYKVEFDPTSEASKIAAHNKEVIRKAREVRETNMARNINKNIRSSRQPSVNVQSNQNITGKSNNANTYDANQFNEIRKGIRHGIDVKQYANIYMNAEQMKELRLGLEHGIDVSNYNNYLINATQMKEIRLGHDHGVGLKLDELKHLDYTAEQTREIRLGLEENLVVSKYIDPKFNADQMKEIRLGLRSGLDVTDYATLNFSVAQMKSLRYELTIKHIVEKIKELFTNIKMYASATLNGVKLGVHDVEVKLVVDDINNILKQGEYIQENLSEEFINNEKDILVKASNEIVTENITPEEKANAVSNDVVKTAGAKEPEINVNDLSRENIEKIFAELDMEQQSVQEIAMEM